MENVNMILILFLVLVILFMILTHTNIDFYNYPTTLNGKCSETKFGCCPDGVNSKIDFNGSNCPPYNPGAGYNPPGPVPVTYPPVTYPPLSYPSVPPPAPGQVPGPQPYVTPYSQPQIYAHSQVSSVPPPVPFPATPYNPPNPYMTTSSSLSEPGPRPPKAAGGIGTQYSS